MRHVLKRQRHLHRHLKYAIARERVNSDVHLRRLTHVFDVNGECAPMNTLARFAC